MIHEHEHEHAHTNTQICTHIHTSKYINACMHVCKYRMFDKYTDICTQKIYIYFNYKQIYIQFDRRYIV